MNHSLSTIDYFRSYLRFRVDRAAQKPITVTHSMPTMVNNVRIPIECRCELTNHRTGRRAKYVLGAACKTERVGGEGDLWLLPNADFSLVASEEEFLILKSWARNGMALSKDPQAVAAPVERQSGCAREAWTEHGFQLKGLPGRAVSSFTDIMAAIRSQHLIVSRTEYDENDWSVTIEHPVKTINYSEVDEVYQTDTGPILLPDLSAERLQQSKRLVECFDLAYSAFNSAGWAEFIIKVPTPVADGVTVNHYSKTRRIEPVRNTLIEVVDEVQPPLRSAVGDRLIRADAAEAPASVLSGNGSSRLESENKNLNMSGY